MKICLISDTHNKHEKMSYLLKPADIIIHAGDISSIGTENEIRNFLFWFSQLKQYKIKIFVAGNHDFLFEKNSFLAKSLIPKNVYYLEDSGIKIKNYFFYGSPVSSPFNDWAFNRPEDKLILHWKAIPKKTTVLITHSPPYGILDYCLNDKCNKGSPSLYGEIMKRIKPKLHVFGHIHEGFGMVKKNNIIFANASVLDENYEIKNKPIIIEI